MNTRLLTLLTLTLLACSPLFSQRMTLADGAKAAVLRTDEVRVYGLLSADVNALDDLLAKDCVYVHSSGKVQTKAELLTDLKNGTLKYLRLQYTATPLIRLYNGDTAIVTGTMQLEVESPAGLVKRTLATTTVYVLQAERWQLASYHSTTATP